MTLPNGEYDLTRCISSEAPKANLPDLFLSLFTHHFCPISRLLRSTARKVKIDCRPWLSSLALRGCSVLYMMVKELFAVCLWS